MFTGIVQAVGKVVAMAQGRLEVEAGDLDLKDVRLGDSIAMGGVCLTVVEKKGAVIAADVSGETLSRTVLGEWRQGTPVNLEKALTLSTPLGGHLVTGHVDGIGEVAEREPAGESVRFRIEAPRELARYIAEKGSICVDGVSLTVNRVEGAAFEVNIIPHTLARTTLGNLKPGSRVNLEVDIIARYLERLMARE